MYIFWRFLTRHFVHFAGFPRPLLQEDELLGDRDCGLASASVQISRHGHAPRVAALTNLPVQQPPGLIPLAFVVADGHVQRGVDGRTDGRAHSCTDPIIFSARLLK